MIIVYGSKILGKRDRVESWGECEHCGRFTRQENFFGRLWAHVFWIPIFPEGPRARFVMQCSGCDYGYRFPEKRLPEIVQGASQSCAEGLKKIRDGERFFRDDEGHKQVSAMEVLAAARMLACCNETDRAEQAVNAAAELCGPVEAHLLRGGWFEFRGLFDMARERFDALLAADPDYGLPLLEAAGFVARQGGVARAIEILQRGAEVEPDNPIVFLELFGYCQAEDRHGEAVAAAERAMSLAPQLADDKKFKKALKKSRKKAGVK